ncbi:pimeloyl-ACP methyl ester carboxylesterase [Prauserella shujinwangii]|uniref:Pimeloyl-ACP methyl ester carboxylesterase n=1 Tax=Prauserella shujinwangii TaxID=1453103 RepID=A0A2T0LKH6_9PSEU|nr:alpha/beta fold hydrolase [Prauserella shujinwangii]PRX43398.1 pimeloyl-ACP methyl ester carboxylesterase [Prauserella shujinwangii]
MIERTATVDGIPMRWLERGEGAPVVFVHGVPTSPELWRHVLGRVPGARCLAWEMVGYGASIPHGRCRDIAVARQAGYLSAWLRHLDLGPVVLVGHDLGGGVAQILAATERDRVAGLVLTNAVCYDSWPIPSVRVLQRLAGVLPLLPDTALYPAFVNLLRRGHDDRARAAESIGIHWRHYVTHGATRGLARQAAALRARDTLAVADRLPGIGVPARVVWGAADQFQRVSYGVRLAEDLGADLDRIDGGRHFTPEDHPDRVAAAVDSVLARLHEVPR